METSRRRRALRGVSKALIFSTVTLVPLIQCAASPAPRPAMAPAVSSTQPSQAAQNAPGTPEEPPSTVSPTPAAKAAVSTPKRVLRGNLPLAVVALYAEFAKYPWPVPTAMAIAACESGGNALAVSRTGDYGVMQIHLGLQSYGQQIYDPAFNIRLAYEHYYKTRGFSPWSTYHNGCYLRYV